MRRLLGGCCATGGAVLLGIAATAPGPWIGLPVGVVLLGIAAALLDLLGEPVG